MSIKYIIDENLVRGLDYYTHTVFEVNANLKTLGAQNTICGGGRYNNLVKSLGGPDVPGVGFSFGLERLMFALESIDFKGDPNFLHLYLMILGEDQKEDGMAMLNRCRLGGLSSDIDFLDKAMKGKFKQADFLNARFIAIYGEKEKEEDMINVKDQNTKKEVRISKHQLYNHIITELMNPSSEEEHDCDKECEAVDGTCSC